MAPTKGERVGNVPNYLISSGASWTDGQYFVGVDTDYVGRTYLTNYSTYVTDAGGHFTNGGYFITNLTLSDTVPVKLGIVKALKFTLNVDNLFNVHYYSVSDINTTTGGTAYKEGLVGAPAAIYGSVTAKF